MTHPGEPSITPTDPSAAEAPLVPPSGPRPDVPGPEQPGWPAQPAYTYPPAAPQGQGYPYAAPPWPPPAPASGGWAQPQPALGQDPAEPLRKARTALGWAIGAAVGAFLALALAVVALFVGGADLAEEGLFYESPRGQAVGVSDGVYLPGSNLEASLRDVLLEFYFDVEDLTCPDTKSVSVSTAVVCTGELDGYQWTGVVFFEDSAGRYVVLEL